MAREPNDPSSVPGIDSSATPTSMLTRSTLRRPDRPDQDESPNPKGQTRPIEERFLLKVDGQLKRSFGSEEAAKTAGSTSGLSGCGGDGCGHTGTHIRENCPLGLSPRKMK